MERGKRPVNAEYAMHSVRAFRIESAETAVEITRSGAEWLVVGESARPSPASKAHLVTPVRSQAAHPTQEKGRSLCRSGPGVMLFETGGYDGKTEPHKAMCRVHTYPTQPIMPALS